MRGTIALFRLAGATFVRSFRLIGSDRDELPYIATCDISQIAIYSPQEHARNYAKAGAGSSRNVYGLRQGSRYVVPVDQVRPVLHVRGVATDIRISR